MTTQRELPTGFILGHGSHASWLDGACLMEAVAYVAGEPHSDSPECACSVLSSIGRTLNDSYDDDERQLLAQLIPRLVGTRSTIEVTRKRSYVMADAAIREITPMGIEAMWPDLAARLRGIAPIVDTESAREAGKASSAVRGEARKRAATDAATDAAAYAAAYAARAATYAATDAAAYANKTPEERARVYSAARRPIVLATIAAYERAIEVDLYPSELQERR